MGRTKARERDFLPFPFPSPPAPVAPVTRRRLGTSQILVCSGSRGARISLNGLNCQSENSQNIRRLRVKVIVFSQFFFSVDKVCMYVAC